MRCFTRNATVYLLALTGLLSGCGGFFTQEVTPKEVVRTERLKMERNIGFKQGFNAGYKQAQEDMIEYLNENAEALVALRNFQQLVTTKGMYAPQIVAVHRPATISPDGQKYQGGSVDLIIRRPAMFANPNVVQDMIGASNTYVVGFYSERSKANLAMANVQTRLDEELSGDKAAVISTGNGYVVVIKSFSGKDYSKAGFVNLTGVPDLRDRDTVYHEPVSQKPSLEQRERGMTPEEAAVLERRLQEYYANRTQGQTPRLTEDSIEEGGEAR